MKNIEIDDELYHYIVKNTEYIGESASSILRRLLSLSTTSASPIEPQEQANEQVQVNALVNDKQPFDTNETISNEAVIVDEPPKSADYLFNYINREELAMQRGAVGRFLLILAALYRVHSDNFSVVTEIRGRGRLYFAKSAEELAESGSSTKPKQISQSPFWVITNTNTTRKKMMLTEVANALGYSQADAEKIRELL
jgi:negative modulator of initiation of replication